MRNYSYENLTFGDGDADKPERSIYSYEDLTFGDGDRELRLISRLEATKTCGATGRAASVARRPSVGGAISRVI